MEKAEGAPTGAYQQLYSEALKSAQEESLYEHTLASAVMEFIDSLRKPFWTGSPTALLDELNHYTSKSITYSREWPKTPSSLSRQLNALKSSFAGQGIDITLTRGKERRINIVKKGGYRND